jgi:FkbM family methyltransferase
MFSLPPLAPVPEWKFGQWNSADPRARVRRRLWWWAHKRGFDGPVTTRWHLGTRLNHHLVGDISFCTYVDGRYEPNEMFAISKLLGPGMTFVDIGANEGVFTLLAAAAVGPSGSVHAFEPSPREGARLRSNVELNRFTNVHVHALALGSKTGVATLNVAGPDHPGHNTLGAFSYAESSHQSVEVPLVTLDDVLEREDVTQLDVVKIDVEGSETAVIRGARRTLERFRPTIVVEAFEPALQAMGSSVRELLDLVRDSGYDVGELDGTPVAGSEGGLPQSLNVICRPV